MAKRKTEKTKFKVGDMVYTYINPNIKARISHFRKGEDGYPNAYKLAIYDEDGYSHSSKWVDEQSVSKKRISPENRYKDLDSGLSKRSIKKLGL